MVKISFKKIVEYQFQIMLLNLSGVTHIQNRYEKKLIRRGTKSDQQCMQTPAETQIKIY